MGLKKPKESGDKAACKKDPEFKKSKERKEKRKIRQKPATE